MSKYRHRLGKKSTTAARQQTTEYAGGNPYIEEEENEATAKAKKRGGSIHSVRAKQNLGKRGRKTAKHASGGPVQPVTPKPPEGTLEDRIQQSLADWRA